MSSLAFYKSDTGLRYWQTKELVANNWQTFAVNYEQRHLDPNLEFIPLYCAYSVVEDEVYFSITPFLPLFASFFYAWLGVIGLAVVPTLAGVATAVGVYKLAQLAGLPRLNLIFWSSVIATPMFFYTVQLWDHSLAMASAIWGVYGAALGVIRQKWQPVIGAGLVMALGLAQRPEMYMMALALGFSLLIVTWPRFKLVIALAVGGLVGMLPVWLLQYWWIGHPFGILVTHMSDYGRPESYVYDCVGPSTNVQAGRFLLYIEGQDPWSFIAAILVITGLFLLVFWLRLPKLQNSKVAILALAAVVVGYAMWALLLWQDALPGLITTFPLIGLSLAYVDGKDDLRSTRLVYKLTLLTSLLFLGAMLAIWPAYGGSHFGARYLLPAYPLLIMLAFYVYSAYSARGNLRKMLRVVGVTLLSLSVLLQLLGVRIFWQQTNSNSEIQEAIVSLPAEAILTNHPFLPTMLLGLEEQFFLYVDSEADFETLVPRLVEADILQFAFVAVEGLPLDVPEQVGEIQVRQISPVLYALETPP